MNNRTKYDHAFEHDNVYGHSLDLLERFAERAGTVPSDAVHLDLGCGFGRIADPLVERFGLHYIGVDGDIRGLQSLAARGFETHQIVFGSEEKLLEDLKAVLNGRPLASLSMLDTLEHLPNGSEVLNVIASLIAERASPAIISVPNVAHQDIGFRLALGEWDYTEDGLLDHTHSRLFNQNGLDRFLQYSGLHTVYRNPVRKFSSDQSFPFGHPAVSPGSAFHGLLSHLREGVDDSSTINQFVQLVLAGPQTVEEPYSPGRSQEENRPFLSIVTRTQGKRVVGLEEVVLALTAQEDTDFEFIVVGHKLERQAQLEVERVLADAVGWMRNKTRFILLDEGNRTRPLNVGFEAARGQYITILDDDDLPFAHWISTFRTLAKGKPGCILRSVMARQGVTMACVRKGKEGIKATEGLIPYTSQFDLFSQLSYNQTPSGSFAVPRSLFQDMGIRFDENLTTTEDWDFLMRCAVIVGVACSSELTSIYRWWSEKDGSSRTEHHDNEWHRNYEAITRKFDQMPLILPAGSTRKIRQLTGGATTTAPESAEERSRVMLLKSISEVLTSWSWRLTKPLRLPARLRGRKDPKLRKCFDLTQHELAYIEHKLRKSGSWRKTAIFRRKRRK